MEIRINDQKIDYTLEHEENLGEVVDGLEACIRKSRMLIISIKMGDRDLVQEPRDQWTSIAIKDVGTLIITARLLQEVQQANLETVYSYLEMLEEEIENGTTQKLDDLLKGHVYMLESLRRIFHAGTSAFPAKELEDLRHLIFGSTVEVISAWPPAIREKAKNLLEKVKQIVSERYKELRNPKAELQISLENLEDVSKDIGKISAMLQTGRDQQAMTVIIRFLELSQQILRILSILKEQSAASLDEEKIGGSGAGAFFKSLNTFLRELVEAFNTRDTVLIADLLEYEVAPRLELLSRFLSEYQVKKT